MVGIDATAGGISGRCTRTSIRRCRGAFADQVRVVPGSGGTKWQQWDLARALGRDKPDVVFAPGYTAPLTASAPTVLTVHDVSYFDHPEWFSPREGWRLRTLTRLVRCNARASCSPIPQFSQQRIVPSSRSARPRERG